MKGEVPFFSVIMPVYNRCELLKRAMESVLIQDFENWELLIVDDCSADGTFDVANEYQLKDKRIKVLRHNKNLGAAAARNTAILEARGIWCSFLDSDNEMKPGYLIECYNSLVGEPEETGIFWTGMEKVRHFKNGGSETSGSVWTPEIQHSEEKTVHFLTNLRIGTGTALNVRTALLKKAGLFDASLRAAEDTDLMYRLIQISGYKYSPKILFRYHAQHGDRLTKDFKNQTEAYLKIHKKHAQLLNKYPKLEIHVLKKILRYAVFSNDTQTFKDHYKILKSKFGGNAKLKLLYFLNGFLGNKSAVAVYEKMSLYRKA